MKKTLQLILAFNLALLGIASYLAAPAFANGDDHAEEDAYAQQQQNAPSTDALEFETPKGGSLSLIVRRALQIVDAADESYELSNAQIIYAETNIVKELGGKQLEVGERVKIERKQLNDFIAKSRELSAQKIAQWQKYAAGANFNLAGQIEPAGEQADESAAEDQDQPDNVDPNQAGLDTRGQEAGKTDAKDDIARAWLIGISILIIAYYLLSNLFNRRGTSTERPARTARKSTRGTRRR